MEVLGIILSLALLMFFAYRGYSVILFAPVFALLAAFSQGLSPMPAYTELFMVKAAIYVKSFFPIFILGAVFGKVMEDTGMAKAIAYRIVQFVGKERSILAVIIAGTVLTYGGISIFVVVFALYPFAAAMFKEADMPKRLIPAVIVLGGATYTMDALPGTPQIQNIIPSTYFGTNIYAAPLLGIIGAILIFCGGLYYVQWRVKSLKAKGEGYGEGHINEIKDIALEDMPDWRLAIIPLLAVLVLNYIFSYVFTWDPNILVPFVAMKLPMTVTAVKNVIAIWALTIAILVGIILAVGLGWRNLSKEKGGLARALNAGAIGSLLAIMNTASEVGYGNVISMLPGFQSIADALLGIHLGGTPLLSEGVTISTLAAMTGSASGGMSIALDIMGQHWLTWANSIGMSPEVLHRVAAMASGGFDSMPHNGCIITILAICGLTHKQSYPDIFGIVCIKTLAAFAIIAINLVTGIV
jgi:H+/gluconate symporter-like permease